MFRGDTNEKKVSFKKQKKVCRIPVLHSFVSYIYRNCYIIKRRQRKKRVPYCYGKPRGYALGYCPGIQGQY